MTTLSDQTVVVITPTAGGGRVARVWEGLRGDAALASAHIVRASDPAVVRDEVGGLLADGATRLLVLGGDGSAHLVANIVLEKGCGHQVAIGLVPVGTGGDLARALGLRRDPRAALTHALHAHARPIDAIEVRTDDGRCRFVVNVASAGISGLVDEAVNAVPNRGAAAYMRASLAAIWRYRNLSCRVSVDREPWYEGKVLLFAVANGTSFGRGMRVAPGARPDDGLADVVLVGDVPRWQVPFRLPQIYRGTHLRAGSYVRWCQCHEVRFEPLAPFPPFDLDGEVFKSAAARFTLLPGALRFLA